MLKLTYSDVTKIRAERAERVENRMRESGAVSGCEKLNWSESGAGNRAGSSSHILW